MNQKRFFFYGVWLFVSITLFVKPIVHLFYFSLGNDNASHVILIPLISAWMLFQERKRIFQHFSSDYLLGGLLLLASFLAGAWIIGFAASLRESCALSGKCLALILFCVAGFAFIFARATLTNARFPFLYRLL